MIEGFEYVLIGLAAVVAGAINALAGGGTLISFPMLMAVGVPDVSANITNTVSLIPGYLGATLAQRKEIKGQESRLKLLAPIGAVGGLVGGIILLLTDEKLFRELIPFLILFASGLLAVQEPLRRRLLSKQLERSGQTTLSPLMMAIPVFLAAVYGGYFGAGLSVIVLAVLALVFEDNLTRLNGLKQAVSFSTNMAAGIFFLFSGEVVWTAAAIMAVGALAGGALGGRLAGQIKPATLRIIVVAIGVIIAAYYFIR